MGKPLYTETRQWPYSVAMYGPMTYYPVALASKALGFPATLEEQARRVYVVGRSFSFAAACAILLWLWFMAGTLGLRGWWRALPVLFLFKSFRMLNFSYSFRPDFPMVALALWAWFVALRAPRSVAGPVAAVLMALAAFYKHTAVLSAFGLLIWLLVDGRRREAVRYAALYALLVGAQSGSLLISTHEEWLENTVRALRSPIYLPALLSFLLPMSAMEILPLAGGVAACLGALGEDRAARPGRWAFAMSFLAVELIVMRVGSDVYYYIEPYCWGCVLAGAVVCRCAQRITPTAACGRRSSAAWILILCIFVAPMANIGVYFWRAMPQQFMRLPSMETAIPDLADLLHSTKGPILTMDGFLAFHTLGPPTLMDPILYSVRASVGDLKTDELIGKIRAKQFELVILTWDIDKPTPTFEQLPFLPSDVVEAVRGSYTPLGKFRQYFVYTPMP